MKRAVIIVAGGAGSRMGGNIPKQFLELKGKPVILHTLERFLKFDSDMEVVLVLADGHRNYWAAIDPHPTDTSGIRITYGGKTRFHSVLNGLQLIGEDQIVGIHDAVRPFVSLGTLERCYSAAALRGSAVPVIEMDDSVRMVKEDGKSVPMDRSRLKRVQTPQVFRSELIKEAYKNVGDHEFTDDASVFEAYFGNIQLVKGNLQNIKITTPTDMKLASVLIQ